MKLAATLDRNHGDRGSMTTRMLPRILFIATLLSSCTGGGSGGKGGTRGTGGQGDPSARTEHPISSGHTCQELNTIVRNLLAEYQTDEAQKLQSEGWTQAQTYELTSAHMGFELHPDDEFIWRRFGDVEIKREPGPYQCYPLKRSDAMDIMALLDDVSSEPKQYCVGRSQFLSYFEGQSLPGSLIHAAGGYALLQDSLRFSIPDARIHQICGDNIDCRRDLAEHGSEYVAGNFSPRRYLNHENKTFFVPDLPEAILKGIEADRIYGVPCTQMTVVQDFKHLSATFLRIIHLAGDASQNQTHMGLMGISPVMSLGNKPHFIDNGRLTVFSKKDDDHAIFTFALDSNLKQAKKLDLTSQHQVLMVTDSGRAVVTFYNGFSHVKLLSLAEESLGQEILSYQIKEYENFGSYGHLYPITARIFHFSGYAKGQLAERSSQMAYLLNLTDPTNIQVKAIEDVSVIDFLTLNDQYALGLALRKEPKGSKDQFMIFKRLNLKTFELEPIGPTFTNQRYSQAADGTKIFAFNRQTNEITIDVLNAKFAVQQGFVVFPGPSDNVDSMPLQNGTLTLSVDSAGQVDFGSVRFTPR